MITSKLHGVLDYITVLFFALSPSLFNLSETAAIIAYALAAIHFLMTILTGFSLGLIKVIPFQFHGFVELAVGLVLAIGPWLLGDLFTETDQLFFSLTGAAILIVWLLTTYKSPLKA